MFDNIYSIYIYYVGKLVFSKLAEIYQIIASLYNKLSRLNFNTIMHRCKTLEDRTKNEYERGSSVLLYFQTMHAEINHMLN